MKKLVEKNLMAQFEVKCYATKTGVKTQLIIHDTIVVAESSNKEIYEKLFDLVTNELKRGN